MNIEQSNSQSFFNKILAAFDTVKSAPNEAVELPVLNLVDFLNELIEREVYFDVGENEFKVINPGRLNITDRNFLTNNYDVVLCTLQQCLLVKYLFTISPTALNIFSSEITGGNKRLSGSERHTKSSDFTKPEIVCFVTKKWYRRILHK